MTTTSTPWRCIWKFPLHQMEQQLPIGARVLTVQEQNGVPTLWVLVDPDAAKEERLFAWIGTGTTLPTEMLERATYIATCQVPPTDYVGALVWHVFEITEVRK